MKYKASTFLFIVQVKTLSMIGQNRKGKCQKKKDYQCLGLLAVWQRIIMMIPNKKIWWRIQRILNLFYSLISLTNFTLCLTEHKQKWKCKKKNNRKRWRNRNRIKNKIVWFGWKNRNNHNLWILWFLLSISLVFYNIVTLVWLF